MNVLPRQNTQIGTEAYDRVGDSYFYLPNTGNYVLYRRGDSMMSETNGWVHWCSGTTGCVGKLNEVAQLQGAGPATSTNFICSTVTLLANDNYVVGSPTWSDGSATAAGFAMLCSGTSGCPSTVSSATALIGSGASQQEGVNSITGLPDGSYIVTSQSAITHCSPTGCNGTVPTSDSLTGFGTAKRYITVLSTGEYVVSCPQCVVGGVAGGFVARCGMDGTGCKGPISAQTGLVGTVAGGGIRSVIPPSRTIIVIPCACSVGTSDFSAVGLERPGANRTPMSTHKGARLLCKFGLMGNYVAEVANASLVVSYEGFDGGKGGVFWFSATDPVIGTVSAAMGLTGDSTDQKIGAGAIYVTPNKDYVSYASATRILTWCPGATGCRGVTVSIANTVTGIPAASGVPILTARAAGDYLFFGNGWMMWSVVSPRFREAEPWAPDATTEKLELAALIFDPPLQTRCPKSGPFQSGPYGETTALVAGGGMIFDLSNNAFLVANPSALNSKGAFTWCSGTSPCVGTVSATRSLTGELDNDQMGNIYRVTLSQEAVPAHYIVRWWRSDNSASSVTVCPTAGGCVGVVTDPAVSLVGTATQKFKYDDAPWLWFLPNGNLLVRAVGEPGGAAQGKSFFMCVPGTACNGTLSANNTFHGDSLTNIFMPPVGSAQYNASSYYAAIPSAVGGLGAVRLCSGESFDCAGEFTAANAAVGSAEHTGLGESNIVQVGNGAWITHQDATYSYVPFVNGALSTGPVTAANWVPGSSSSVVLDLTSTPLGPIYANGNLSTVSIGLNQQYHNHFEALYAESAEDEVILRLWVDEPVQMIGWAASMEVVDPSSGNITQTLVFNESGRARVQRPQPAATLTRDSRRVVSCGATLISGGHCGRGMLAPVAAHLVGKADEDHGETGEPPAARDASYRAQIKLSPAVFFTVPNWDTILDFHPAPIAQVTPTSCMMTDTCTVHVNVSGPGAVAPYRVALDGEECTVLEDSTATDVHVTLPTGKPVGSYSLKVTSAGGRFAVLSFEYTSASPILGGVTPACPAHGCAITITGMAFSQPTVRMDGVTMTCPTVTSTSITCQAPATGVAEGHTITVTNSNGLAATTAYAYNIPHPTISGVSPQVEATGGGITITGSGFLEPVVTINGADCAVVSSTATQIVCTAPQAPAEHCNLTVISAGGYAASTPYTYTVHRPTVTGASPACGPLGCQITVQGSDFYGPTVTIDGVACPLVGNATATSLTCTAPASTREATNLTVIDAGGFAASVGYQYSFPHPTISGVSPQVEATGGDITITGSGFLEPVVTIGGAACAVVSSTATQIVCTAPQAPAEHCNLTVISAGGYAAFGTYTYTDPLRTRPTKESKRGFPPKSEWLCDKKPVLELLEAGMK
ncbi:hypothetical protein PAPYR_7609 [Paratrimastix pyriformis]|uniref:IPT/TIG domain-containing protein n=1 Tax=Paratrimastix pyriformis TaxID=342808 RepID=A0ABQ8UGG6_9EUKA|nr:hypothetical protein PAPYR_7609 [Paratrimastix pyriformis]